MRQYRTKETKYATGSSEFMPQCNEDANQWKNLQAKPEETLEKAEESIAKDIAERPGPEVIIHPYSGA